ncbi:hypothetical protein KR093_000242 [Drosophila rubida]|uniref:Bromodomain-containing protein DDB_G0280777 n=1 Tax=Drosophila rubida TaxID=30044 RepID=A0AAD4JXW1_9MUSC|nr:hypothetical protein KR093_000242 [Drosophila rubida]
MRLLILSLLAATAHGHAISYRNNLQAFAPARGEFPVQSELAQGYLRYLDNTGAERLVGFNYPEPLYGVRNELYTPEQLRVSSSSKLDAQQQHLALFRAWCEQRYNAMRIELERLRAEGKQPSANMLSQFEPLEQLIKTNAFEPVPGLSPEVQRARDEHLRIWNESRLQVLQAELAQGGQPQALDQRFSPEAVLLKTSAGQLITKLSQAQSQPQSQIKQIAQQAYMPLEAPQPVQETAEVLRAREEHLRLYNEALRAQPATKTIPSIQTQAQPQQTPQLISQLPQIAQTPKLAAQLTAQTSKLAFTPTQTAELTPQTPQLIPQSPQIAQTPKLAIKPAQTPQTPQLTAQTPKLAAPLPVEETPEVKRAREEHLKQYNAEIQRQQQQSIVPLPTAAPKTTKSEYFGAGKPAEAIAPLPVATLKNSLPQTPAAAPLPNKNAHEQKIQLLTQIKLKAEDKVADYEDKIRYAERERDAERIREQELRREEQKQAELEREREQLRLIEEQKLLAAEQQALRLQEQQRMESERLQEAQRLQAEQQFVFAIDNTPSQPSSGYKIITPTPVNTPQTATQPQAIAQQQQVQNGFFLRIQAGQQGGEAIAESMAQNPFLIRYIQQPQQAQVKLLSPTSDAIISSSSSGASSTAIAGGLSALQQAEREHFKAHEIALEQLRLANLKNPEAIAAPCQHN